MLSRGAGAFIEPFPRLAGNPIPCLRDRAESTNLLDRAVRPFDLHVPKYAVGGPRLPRFEDRPTGIGKASVHARRSLLSRYLPPWQTRMPRPEKGGGNGGRGGGGDGGGLAPSTRRMNR